MRDGDGVDGVDVDGGARPFGRSNQYTDLQGGSDGTGYNSWIPPVESLTNQGELWRPTVDGLSSI